MTALGVALLGFVTSMAFNVTLERMSVAGETPRAWFGWGVRALLAAVVDLQYVFAVAVVVGAWIGLRRLVPGFDRLAARPRQAGRPPGAPAAPVGSRQLRRDRLRHRADLPGDRHLDALAAGSAVMTTVSNMTVEQRGALCAETVQRRGLLDRPRGCVVLQLPAGARDAHLARCARLVAAGAAAPAARRPQRRPAHRAGRASSLLAVMMWVAPWRLVMQSERPVVCSRPALLRPRPRAGRSCCLDRPDGSPRMFNGVAEHDPRLRDSGAIEVVFSTH